MRTKTRASHDLFRRRWEQWLYQRDNSLFFILVVMDRSTVGARFTWMCNDFTCQQILLLSTSFTCDIGFLHSKSAMALYAGFESCEASQRQFSPHKIAFTCRFGGMWNVNVFSQKIQSPAQGNDDISSDFLIITRYRHFLTFLFASAFLCWIWIFD